MSNPSGFNGSYSPCRERVAFVCWPASIGFNGIAEETEDRRIWPIVNAWLHGKVWSRFIAACGRAVSLTALVVDELCKASQSQCKLHGICHIYLAYPTELRHIWEAEKCLFYGSFGLDVGRIIPVSSLWGPYNPLRWIWGRRWGKSSLCSPLRRNTIGAAELRGLNLCLAAGEWGWNPVMSN